ncbi:MAG: HAD-IIB family hydrolase [Candidatus Paceibacterota bacterium]|jgi:hypothetical protein
MNFKNKRIIIFDLDRTLTESKQPLDAEMSKLLEKLLGKKMVAITSGGPYKQFEKQFLGSFRAPTELLGKLFLFPTCASSFYRFDNGNWKNIYFEKLSDEERVKIISALKVALAQSNYEPPVKPFGEIIEDRESQITFSALGQQAPMELKEKWDPTLEKRQKVITLLMPTLPDYEIQIGGSTSIDVTRKGIDKGYGILQIEKHLGIPVAEMVFIGDRLSPGGNDYPVVRTGVQTIAVSGPEETKKVIEQIINS